MSGVPPNELRFLLRPETSLRGWRVKPQQKTWLDSILPALEQVQQAPFAFSIVGPCGSTKSVLWPEYSKQPSTASERPDPSLGPADVQSYRDPEQPISPESSRSLSAKRIESNPY